MSSNETSIWDDFGSNSAVITPDANAYDKHEQEMLALNIPARSGDDSFEVQTTDSEGLSAAMGDDKNSDPLGEQDEDSYRINTETGEASEAATEGNESDVDADYAIEDSAPELESSVTSLREHTEGFNAMVDKVLSDGDIDQETVDNIQAEYLSDEGLSEATYKTLEEKGYSRSYVNAFIQGQEALTNAYASQIMNYVGGQDKFNATYAWLESNNPAMQEMLDDALENLNTKNVKAIFESVNAQRVARYGKAPQRNLASRSQPQRPQGRTDTAQGFSSVKEMTDAMSDKRYSNDPAYRALVEKRVALM